MLKGRKVKRMSDIQIFIPDKDNEGEWRDIDDGLLDLSSHDAKVRADTIDNFVEEFSLELSESIICGMIADCFKYKNLNDTSDKIADYAIYTVKKIAEQLKEMESK